MNEEKVRQLYNDMNVHSSILVIGAGASFEMGLPLYAQFPEMIWKVLDEFPNIKVQMGYKEEILAKKCIGSDINLIKESFTYIEKSLEVCQRFKKIFCSICAEHSRQISNVHKVICQLIHENKIKLVISLNWDDLLEQAWEELYGTEINSEYTQLIKPHGDVRKIEEKWIFPNNPGFISQENLDVINSLVNEKPISLVILGYSENDETIVKSVIEPISNVSETYRIAPDKNATISLSANEAMLWIKKYCKDIDNNWKYLNFKKQNGMERALLGYRLTPGEIEACARFSCIEYAKNNLQHVHYTIIQSEPGCGKSITAYQIAYDYMIQGWEILLYRNKNQSGIDLLETKYKTVFIIDDAQQFSDSDIEDVIYKADTRHKVIITKTISNTSLDGTVTITNKQAVKEIKKFYLNNEKKVIAILNSFNPREKIGNLFMQKPLSRLLEMAEKEATPWLFNYSLRGGWEKIKQDYLRVRELQNAEYTLFTISVKQILSLDEEIQVKDIVEANKQCFDLTYEKTLSDIEFLRRNRLVVGNLAIRTLHLQMASRIIMLSYSVDNREERQKFIECIRYEFLHEKTELLGIVWLTNLTFAYNDSSNFHSEIYIDAICDILVKRCFSQDAAEKKRDAGYLLELLVRNSSKYSYQFLINNYLSELQKMIEETNYYSVWSNRDICNSMYNDSKELKIRFVSGLDITDILIRMKSITQESLYGWASFLDRLLIGQSEKWRNLFFSKMPLDEICTILRNVSIDKIGSLCEMLWVLHCYNKEFAIKEYYNILPILKNALENSFTETLREMDFNFKMIFWGENLFGRGRKNKEQKRALSELCATISRDTVVKAIENGIPRDWKEIFRFLDQMEVVNRGMVREIIKSVDCKKLEVATEGLWEEQPEDLQYILLMIASYDRKKIEQLVKTHIYELKIMKSTIAVCAPRITCEYVLAGGRVELYEQWLSWGDIPVEMLKEVKKFDVRCFEKIVIDNKQIILNRFLECEPIYWSESSKMFCLLCDYMPNFVDEMLKSIAIDSIKKNWENKICNINNAHNRKKDSCKNFVIMISTISQIIHNKELQSFFENIRNQISDQMENVKEENFTFALRL